ncbi:hypothetical protein QOT17_023633 [Balamuthia mandrillaris]
MQISFHSLKSIHVTFPFKHITINLTSPLQTDFMGYQYIFIIRVIATHFMILHSPKDKSAEEVSCELVKMICKLGFPKIVQSDNGSEFINKIMSAPTELQKAMSSSPDPCKYLVTWTPNIVGPLELYETNYRTSPKTSFISTITFQTLRLQQLRPSYRFNRSLVKAFIRSLIIKEPTSHKISPLLLSLLFSGCFPNLLQKTITSHNKYCSCTLQTTQSHRKSIQRPYLCPDDHQRLLAIHYWLQQTPFSSHVFSLLQPNDQLIILGHDFIHKSAVEEHLHKHILKVVIKKYLQENEALLIGPFCTFPEAVLHLNTGDHPPVFLSPILFSTVANWLCTGIIVLVPPDSPWNSPLTIVDANSDFTQGHVNPYLLNKFLLDLTYSIPTICSIISKVQGYFITSILDLNWTYMQCPGPVQAALSILLLFSY